MADEHVRCTRHELDITGRVEGVEETVLTGSENSLKGQAWFACFMSACKGKDQPLPESACCQARRYLTQDATYLVVSARVLHSS